MTKVREITCRALLCLLVPLGAGCGAPVEPAGVELTTAMLKVRGDGPQPNIRAGRHSYRWVRRVPQDNPKAEKDKVFGDLPSEIAKAGLPEKQWTLDEMAEGARAYLYVGGHEYIAEEPDYETARALLSNEPAPETSPGQVHDEGPMVQAHIIGADGRIHWGVDRMKFPFRAIATFDNGHCTAFMIGRTVAITAAHCLHNSSGQTNTSFGFIPEAGALGGGTLDPFGTWYNNSYSVFIPSGFINGRNHEFDYAVIRFYDFHGVTPTPPGAVVGWFGTSSNTPISVPLRINGYPKDKGGWDLWGERYAGTAFETNSWRFKHLIDATGGMSGAPAYRESDNRVFGIHVRSHQNWCAPICQPPKWNEATRWNSGIYNFVHTLVPEWPSN